MQNNGVCVEYFIGKINADKLLFLSFSQRLQNQSEKTSWLKKATLYLILLFLFVE